MELDGSNNRDDVGLRQKHEEMQMETLEEISRLEALLKYKEKENGEIQQQLSVIK